MIEDAKRRWGLRDIATGEVNKTTRARAKQVNIQKPRTGYRWVELPDGFDASTHIIDPDGLIQEKTNGQD
jgi:hypothetical protein